MPDQNNNMNHAVRYDGFGGTDVLYIAELPKPEPGPKQVLVKVKAAGINPGEASIREGRLQKMFPSTFPSGEGSDFAGVIETTGNEVKDSKPGDEVIGFSHERSSHAEYVAVDESQVTLKPVNVTWVQAGGLFVAGTTAYAAIQALSLKTRRYSGSFGCGGRCGVRLQCSWLKARGQKYLVLPALPIMSG